MESDKNTKEKLLHDLRERHKELNLLYEVTKLSSRADLSLENFLQKSVELIPPAWHYPEITCARIIVDKQKYKTKNFRKTQWIQSEDIRVNGEKLGAVEVYYLEEKPELDQGPFLKEERNLIRTFSSLLSRIIERKKADKTLKESEIFYSSVIENSKDAVIIHHDGVIKFANSAASQFIGIPKNDFLGKRITDFIHPDDRENVLSRFEQRKAGKDVESIYEISLVKKDGSDFPAEINVSLIQYQGKPAGLVFIRDITKRKKAENGLKKSLQEKEVLIKEIHHRVKNNMQVISSLINIQARRMKDPKAREIFKNTRNRVMSMALVHERLYRSEDLSGIDFSTYIEQMAVHLMSYYRDLSKNIELKKDMEDIFLDVTKAVPLGLITNELITNSLKHAFPKNRKGEITIKFYKKGKTYHLTISDNGIGFPQELDFKKAESMGLDLVNSLISQINGRIELSRDKDTAFKITFED